MSEILTLNYPNVTSSISLRFQFISRLNVTQNISMFCDDDALWLPLTYHHFISSIVCLVDMMYDDE